MKDLTKITNQIIKDFGSEVNSVEIDGEYVNFKIANRRFWAKLTKTGKIKKNSYHQILI